MEKEEHSSECWLRQSSVFILELFFLSVPWQRTTTPCHSSLRNPARCWYNHREALAHLRPGDAMEFCHDLGSFEQPLAHDSLCSEAISKKHIHLMAEGSGTERSMPTNKASWKLTSFVGSDPLLHWALDLHGITKIAKTAGIKKQTGGLFFQKL